VYNCDQGTRSVHTVLVQESHVNDWFEKWDGKWNNYFKFFVKELDGLLDDGVSMELTRHT